MSVSLALVTALHSMGRYANPPEAVLAGMLYCQGMEGSATGRGIRSSVSTVRSVGQQCLRGAAQPPPTSPAMLNVAPVTVEVLPARDQNQAESVSYLLRSVLFLPPRR